MRPETRQRLLDTSARFYERHGDSFDTTRARPWPGWDRLWKVMSARLPADRPITCLDAGCGNGRFGLFLQERIQERIQGRVQERQPALRYAGLDLDESLLESSRRALAGLADVSLHRVDLVADDLPVATASQDLVALFGVLHHVPDEATRHDLLRRLAPCVSPGGVLVVSIWRLDQDPDRFERKRVDWSRWNREHPVTQRIDVSDLDSGDALLSWRGDGSTPRYCHFPTDAEIERLADLGEEMELFERFEADGPTGRDNLYLVWRRRASC